MKERIKVLGLLPQPVNETGTLGWEASGLSRRETQQSFAERNGAVGSD